MAADFSGLHAWADAMATILLLELCVLLLLIAVLVGLLAYAARWLQMHVLPVLNTSVPLARTALQRANEGNERVIQGVAQVYGIRRAAETALQILLHGREGQTAGLEARGNAAPRLDERNAPGANAGNPTAHAD